jgi:hypothetical protein
MSTVSQGLLAMVKSCAHPEVELYEQELRGILRKEIHQVAVLTLRKGLVSLSLAY